MVAAEVLSTLICPVYGEFYSFPWKRGPHDNILEFVEANQIFESLRQVVFNGLRDFDFVSKLLIIMQKEDEAQHVQVKCSILRLFTQLLRSFDTAYTQTKKTESALDLFLSNPNFKNQIQ